VSRRRHDPVIGFEVVCNQHPDARLLRAVISIRTGEIRCTGDPRAELSHEIQDSHGPLVKYSARCWICRTAGEYRQDTMMSGIRSLRDSGMSGVYRVTIREMDTIASRPELAPVYLKARGTLSEVSESAEEGS
jgi:hypothetical protein